MNLTFLSTVAEAYFRAMKESKIKRYILISGGSLNVTGRSEENCK